MIELNDLADQISEGLPSWQRDANLEFLQRLHGTLKDGGVWISPALGRVYKKSGDGFEVVADETQLMALQDGPHVKDN